MDNTFNITTFIGDSVIDASRTDSNDRDESIKSRRELREGYIERQKVARNKYWESGVRKGMLMGAGSTLVGMFIQVAMNAKKSNSESKAKSS